MTPLAQSLKLTNMLKNATTVIRSDPKQPRNNKWNFSYYIRLLAPFAVPIFALIITVFLPAVKFIYDACSPPFTGRPSLSVITEAVSLSLSFSITCLFLEIIVALHLGRLLAAIKAGSWLIFAFTMPLLFGPTICALLWKLLVDPNSGLIAQFLRTAALPFPDWTQNSLAALVVVGSVQVWTWGLVGGACIATLFRDDTEKARALYLLDGGKPAFADLWALWATRREWLALIVLALAVENLRAFESIHILTAGGPGRATCTLAYLVFETGFLTHFDPSKNSIEATWALILVTINGIACYCLLSAARWRISIAKR